MSTCLSLFIITYSILTRSIAWLKHAVVSPLPGETKEISGLKVESYSDCFNNLFIFPSFFRLNHYVALNRRVPCRTWTRENPCPIRQMKCPIF